jgi:glycosyltransferase involved in cell wall biosynthesis
MLSIIIPTLNEEKYLPQLLKSIKKQDFESYEIIVADGGSKDRTLDIAKEHNCRIVSGGSPAEGKNKGAKAAKGDLLLFTDADNLMPDGFLEKSVREFEKKGLAVGSFLVEPFEGKKIIKLLFNLFYNIPIRIMEGFLPHTAIAIIIRSDIFEKVNGFNKEIILAEDHDMGRRAAKLGKFGILKSAKVLTSERRFKEDGWIKTYMKYIYAELHMIIKGPVKNSAVIKYNFNHYSKNK